MSESENAEKLRGYSVVTVTTESGETHEVTVRSPKNSELPEYIKCTEDDAKLVKFCATFPKGVTIDSITTDSFVSLLRAIYELNLKKTLEYLKGKMAIQQELFPKVVSDLSLKEKTNQEA